MHLIDKATLKKYDVPGPRYTSYPTAPEWQEKMAPGLYPEALARFGQTQKPLSLYLHIPFCETLCTFCGCHTFIRKQDPNLGDAYLDSVTAEIEMAASAIDRKAKVVQFHLGGGTPNYLSRDQMNRLFAVVEKHFDLDREGEVAIEVDPRTVDEADLKHFRELGFNRISFGVQDFDDNVQAAVNRIQPYDLVARLVHQVRALGFQSLNLDLIYGLPFQTLSSFDETVRRVVDLRPDRIALYSYAYVPWLKPHQKKIDATRLPSSETKLEIFLMAREQFINGGYESIAMDHFALSSDSMAEAYHEGALYRNFMGYTVKPAGDFLGLGVSAIGYISGSYFQNIKKLGKYHEAIKAGQYPVHRGLQLSEDDLKRQWVIDQWMCRFLLNENEFLMRFGIAWSDYFSEEQVHMKQCVEDGLITFNQGQWSVTDLGKLFVRNICMGFDAYLKQKSDKHRFSRTV